MGFLTEIFETAEYEAEIRENARSQKSGAQNERSQKSPSFLYELIEQSALDLKPETSYDREVSKKRYSVIFAPG